MKGNNNSITLFMRSSYVKQFLLAKQFKIMKNPKNKQTMLFNLDQEADSSITLSSDKTLQELSSNLTQLLNETTSFGNDSFAQQVQKTARRRRRGTGRHRRGLTDWWYGNWCGADQGGYEDKPKKVCKYFCYRSTSYVNRACRNCLPPQDGLDDACMEHDRCSFLYNITINSTNMSSRVLVVQ